MVGVGGRDSGRGIGGRSGRTASAATPLNGAVPLLATVAVTALFARSCIQGLPFLGGGGDALPAADRDLLTDPPPPDPFDPPADDSGPADTAPHDRSDDRLGPEPNEPEDGPYRDTTSAEPDGADAGPVPTLPSGAELTPMLQPLEPVCPDDRGEEERHLQWHRPPPRCIDLDRVYVATLETSRGDIHIELDTENAPVTVNNFVFLARRRYYDGTGFHTAWPGDHISGGFPLGYDARWMGLPGYTIDDELPAVPAESRPYSVATVTLGEPHNNRGAFYIDSGTDIDRYDETTRFGRVVDPASRAVVDAIDATGTEGTGVIPPGRETVIHRVVITDTGAVRL